MFEISPTTSRKQEVISTNSPKKILRIRSQLVLVLFKFVNKQKIFYSLL